MTVETFSMACLECCDGDPPCCDGDPPESLFVHGLAGITNSGCMDCEVYNVAALEFTKVPGECRWEATGLSGGCGAAPSITDNGDGTATLTIGGATYTAAEFVCDDANEFTLDSAGTDCDDWPPVLIATPDEGETECGECPVGIAPENVLLTMAGVTDSECGTCEDLNAQHLLLPSPVDPCTWAKNDLALFDCGDPLPPEVGGEVFVTYGSGSGWRAEFSFDATPVVEYAESEPGPNCFTKRTLTRVGPTGSYCNFPDTITIEAAA